MPLPKYHWLPELPGKHHPRLDHTKFGLTQLPDSIDMEPFMAPVFDQGDLGSCTGNAIAGLMEYRENKLAGLTNQHFNFITLSRLYVYYNERAMEGTVKQDAGAIISDGMKSLTANGICTDILWPYDINQFTVKPPEAAYTDGVTRKVKGYVTVDQTQEALTTVLASHFPIVFGATIYSSFESDQVAANGLVPMPDVQNEQCLGGHAILICGYDNTTHLFKVRNSWGADWGDNGYCYFPYDYILSADLASDFITIEC